MAKKSKSDTAAPSARRVPDLPTPTTLAGQPALVTGANSGLGRACAIGLARAGADIVVNYIDHPEAAEAVIGEITALGRKAVAIKADVSDEAQVEAMFAEAVAVMGTLHIVVCNAGLQDDAPFEEMTLEQWNKVIGVNLTGQFLCAREAAREFRRRGLVENVSSALGKIICMSSVHQQVPWAGHVNYAASKGGVMMLMQSMAQELAAYRIRVNSIAPGAIRTEINKSVWNDPERYAGLLKLMPYGRIGEPSDIAQAVAWLASDASDYITGTTLFVDGGMTLYPGFIGNG